MKSNILLLALLFSGLSSFCQTGAYQYLMGVPVYNGDPCYISDSDTTALRIFNEKKIVFRDTISNDLDRRTAAVDRFMEKNEDQIRENMITQAGYSKEDAQKLKHADKMSEEQKMAIANNMLMEKMNMNIDDFKKLAEMDTASQKRWAQGYGTMMMADAMADPQKHQEEQKHYKNQFDVASEQQRLLEKTRAGLGKYQQLFDTLQVEADTARQQLNREVEQRMKEMDDCDNRECEQQIAEGINSLKKVYCAKFTPRYKDIVSGLYQYIINSIRDYDSLDVVSNRLREIQTGIEYPEFKPGISALSIIKFYADCQANIFKYYIPVSVSSMELEGEEGGTDE